MHHTKKFKNIMLLFFLWYHPRRREPLSHYSLPQVHNVTYPFRRIHSSSTYFRGLPVSSKSKSGKLSKNFGRTLELLKFCNSNNASLVYLCIGCLNLTTLTFSSLDVPFSISFAVIPINQTKILTLFYL